MQHVTEYFDLELAPIRQYLSACSLPFDTSQLYSAAADAKFVDESIRKSKFRIIKDPKLFDLCDAVVRSLSARSTDTEFLMVRNDCTHIAYEKGGFFNAHADYLSVTSNLIEEHTLILSCAVPGSAPAKGGLTVIQPNRDVTIESKASTTANSGVLFRKDLTHSSTPLLEVTFPVKRADRAPSQSLLGGGATKMYVLASSDIEQFPGSALHTFLVESRIAAAAEGSIPLRERFYSYEASDCTYDEFAVLYHIYTRRYVSTEQITAASGLITRMGVASKLLLLDADVNATKVPVVAAATTATTTTTTTTTTAPATKIDAPSDSSSSAVGGPGSKAAAAPAAGSDPKQKAALPFHPLNAETAAKASAAAAAKPMIVSGHDDRCDYIICNGQPQLRALNHRAKALGLPYIPFRLLYAEGILAYGGGMYDEPPLIIKMLPVWFSIGDRDNIVGFRSLGKKNDWEKSPQLTDKPFVNRMNTQLKPDMLRSDLRVKLASLTNERYLAAMAAAGSGKDTGIQTRAAVASSQPAVEAAAEAGADAAAVAAVAAAVEVKMKASLDGGSPIASSGGGGGKAPNLALATAAARKSAPGAGGLPFLPPQLADAAAEAAPEPAAAVPLPGAPLLVATPMKEWDGLPLPPAARSPESEVPPAVGADATSAAAAAAVAAAVAAAAAAAGTNLFVPQKPAAEPYDLLLPYDYESFHEDGATVTFNAQFALPDDSVTSIIKLCCVNDSYTDFWPPRVIAYPEGDSYPQQDGKVQAAGATAAATAGHPRRVGGAAAAASASGLFHYSSAGNVVFNASEAKYTSARLTELNFPRRVQHCLQTIGFALPQQYSKVESHFCNESIYGKFTFLECVGLIRLYTESDLLGYLTPVLPIVELAEIVAGYCFGGDETAAANADTSADGLASVTKGDIVRDVRARDDAKDFFPDE